MIRLALDAITSFSTRPLHLASWAGVVTIILGLAMLGFGTARWIGGESDATLLVLGWLTLLGGVQLLGQGILGEYVGRLGEQSKGRPLFLIESVERFDPAREFNDKGQPRGLPLRPSASRPSALPRF
jgi:dolichol-phosphate mannosyltransferase